MRGISDHNYEHAQRVWKAFSTRDLGEYHDLHLKTDVLLLSNVFEAFRNTCLEHYCLDPPHFYTSPRLAWQAYRKKTGIELELLANYDMSEIFERGIKGGIIQPVHRYAKANNKYMDDKFNHGEESILLQYLDANNLYGWGMSQLLPTGGFNWVDDDDVSKLTPDEIGR